MTATTVNLRSKILGVLFGALAWPSAAADLAGQAIQLRHGEILVGEVQSASGDGLTFRRLDNGGVLELDWSDLTQTSADRVRRLKGLLIENEEPVTVLADVLVFEVAGGVRETLVGRIVDESETTLSIRCKGTTLDVRRPSIKDRKRREVPILEVYTRQDYYDERVAEIDPGSNADRHLALADELRRAGDLERAKSHVEQARDLGGGRQAPQIEAMLARLQVEIESKAERDKLTEIQQLTNRGNFDAASRSIQEFEQQFGADSKLATDLDREKRRFERARKDHLVENIRQLWGQKIHRVSTEVLSDPKFTISRARDYAENRMAEDIFTAIAGTLSTTEHIDIEVDEVRSLWEGRNSESKGRLQTYTYGEGSWVLGAEDVIKDTKIAKEGEQDDGLGSDNEELKRVIKLIREQSKRARDLARRSGGGEETEESWWKSQKLTEKRTWLRAYFAEYGGQMEVARATALPCLTCSGAGTITEVATSGAPVKSECPSCHGTRFLRVIRAR